MKTTENFRKVNLDEIETSSFNVRDKFHEDSLNELARSMEQNGLIHPLNLRAVGKNKYELICGERRFRAAKLLKWKSIDANIRDITLEEAKELCLIENIQREDVSPAEEARAYKQLFEIVKSVDELVTRTGKSESYVRLRLKLNDLIPELMNLLDSGEITTGVASVICGYSEMIQKDIFKRFFNRELCDNWFDLTKENVRKRIESAYTTRLNDYKFDLTECRNCAFNTANFSLFAEGCGNCTNRKCLQEKNASHLLAEVVRLKKEDENIVICTPVYGTTNQTVIERLKALEYEIEKPQFCYNYPVRPTDPHADLTSYNEQMRKINEGYEDGTITKFIKVKENDLELCYIKQKIVTAREELQNQINLLTGKDKRNKELRVENTVKDTKEVMYNNEIEKKEFSHTEEQILYFFMLSAVPSKHYPLLGISGEKYYLKDDDIITILEGLNEERKTVIRRDYLVSRSRDTSAQGLTCDYFLRFMKEHFLSEVEAIEKKYNEVYNKRLKKITERKKEIKKQLEKENKKTSKKKSKQAA